jgi:NMD protein affecting ribosome stability and mRNA decay
MYCPHCGAEIEKDSEGVPAHRAPVCGPFMSEGGIRYEGGQNVAIRLCAWCETMHPEHVSVEWTHGERLYFCTDNCLREWSET